MSTAQKVGVHCHSNAETLSQECETVMSSPAGPQVNTGPMPAGDPDVEAGHVLRQLCGGTSGQVSNNGQGGNTGVKTLSVWSHLLQQWFTCALAKSPSLFKNQQVKQMSRSYLQNQVQNIPSILTTAVGSLSSRSPHRI